MNQWNIYIYICDDDDEDAIHFSFFIYNSSSPFESEMQVILSTNIKMFT